MLLMKIHSSLVNLVIYFVLLTGGLILTLLHYYVGLNFTLLLEVVIVLVSVYAILSAKTRMKWFSSFMLFLSTFVLFNFSRVFLDLFGLYKLNASDKYIWYTISDQTMTRSLLLLLLGFIAANFGFYTYDHLNKSRLERLQIFPMGVLNNESLYKVLFTLLIAVTPGTVLKLVYDLYFLKQNGFLALYTDMIQAPVPLRISWFLFSLIFPVILIFRQKRGVVIGVILLYCLVASLDALKGTRNSLLRPLLFLGWYYYSYYSKRDLNLFKLTIIGISVLYFAFYSLALRSEDSSILAGIGFVDIAVTFFSSQGVTFLVMANFLDFQAQMVNPSHFYIFYPIQVYLLRFLGGGGDDMGAHTQKFMYHSLSLDHKLTYAVNPDLYLSGSGYGSSYVVELYALGGVGAIVLGSFLVGYFINKFECDFRLYPLKLIFAWYWVSNTLWMSRGGFLPNVIMILLSYFIYYAISNFLSKRQIASGLA